jgi:hypothetical protein
MSWHLSRFRAGDLVEVRSKEEILATLDQHGSIDGMPLMPEMLQYCGRRFRVGAVAHKTCDTACKMGTGRRLSTTVHLAGLRCDGSAHGGCEADCNLFWKDAWLKPATAGLEGSAKTASDAPSSHAGGRTEAELLANTRQRAASGKEEETVYACQATKLYEASELLAWWEPRQYVFDVVTRNHSMGRVLRVLWLASLRHFLQRVPYGYRLVKRFNEWMHQRLTGRGAPSLHGKFGLGESTPTGRLDLKPGERVRIKSKEQIEQTVDATGRNRGLKFDPEEMAPYCGRVFTVRGRVTQIIDETTGKMIQMKQPCITLEGVACKGDYAGCRLNCPRAILAYWRELWLERVERDVKTATTNEEDAEAPGARSLNVTNGAGSASG